MHRRLSILLILLAILSCSLSHAQLSKVWQSKYNGTAAASDEVDASTTDSQGNFYVAGLSYGPAGYNAVAIKYDSSGDALWTSPLLGPGDRRDAPKAVAVGNQGDLFMLCSEDYPPGAGAIKTVKFNSSGGVEWREVLDKGNFVFAYSADLSLDDSENVYVCGSEGNLSFDSAIVAKYAADGSLRWTRTISLPRQVWCRADHLRTDSSGNVYVLGNYMDDTYGGRGYLAKLTPGGDLAWSRIYDLANPSGIEFALLAVTGDGGILISGAIDDSLGTNALVLKYKGNGDPLWPLVYNDHGADLTVFQDLAGDHDGNSYLTGYAQVSDSIVNEIITISVDTAGHVRWEGRYDGPYNGNQQPNSLALDASGNVYVAGEASDSLSGGNAILLKYGPAGHEEWERISKAPAQGYSEGKTVNVCPSGKVCLGATSVDVNTGYDILVLSYDADGTELWKNRYNASTSAFDEPLATTVDDSDNVIVTGYTTTGMGLLVNVVKTVKFGADGSVRWAAAYPDSGSAINEGEAITHDKSGNLYIAGTMYNWTVNAPGAKNIVTIKYSPDGNLLWSKVFVSPGGSYDNRAVSVALDDSGNVLVAGSVKWDPAALQSNSTDFTVVKYSPEGDQRWAAHYDHQDLQDAVTGMALDDSGNVYVTGISQGANSQYDYATVKFDVGTGAVRWVQRFDDSIHGEDHPRGIAIDDSGSVYVTGFASDSAVVQAAITIKYNRGGDQLWVDRFVVDSLERYEQNEGWQVALDKQYHPIVGLTEYRQSLRSMLVKYNPDGTIQWRSAAAPFNLRQMVLDGGDNAFAVGYSTGNRPVVTRFTNLGVQSWAFVDSSVTGSDYLDAHLDHSGKMYLSLDGQSVGTDRDFVVVKYSQGPDGVRKAPGVLPTTFRLHNAYPNPFNPRTRIEYALPSRQPVVLKVFNLLGEEVSTLVNEVQEPGDRYADFNAAGLASGVYFYRLQAGPFTGVRKVLLMK